MAPLENIKTPPYSEEAEQGVLGCMLLDKLSVETAGNMLSEDDFYIEKNKWIFSAIKKLASSGSAVDSLTVMDRLTSDGNMQKIGVAYIAQLQDMVPFTSNIEQYCRIVKEKAVLRSIITEFGNIINKCYDGRTELKSIIDEAEAFVYDLSMERTSNAFVSLKEEVPRTMITLSEIYQNDGIATGVLSGFTKLDEITNGFQPSDLILLCARPSVGKTALGLGFALNAAMRHSKSVAFFSLEMSAEQLVLRAISHETDVNSMKIRKGRQSPAEWKKITLLNSTLQENDVRLFIDDTSGISTGDMLSKLRRLQAKEGLDMVVIDYLQLMTASDLNRNANREQEISSISRGLKKIAKELKVPVVALAQLSRSPEKRGDGRPQLADIRESGAIEQDADIVLMLYRKANYDKTYENQEETELIIAKHRNGATGTIKLSFLSEYAKYVDFREEDNKTDEQ
ncbi:MAG: replicative DNA helicase [Eubacteriaceae bacterium]|nr:replicative DNA helicase [Eubacteriaceae bacterium]